MILLAGSKTVRTKRSEIKYEKNMTLLKTANAIDPAKRGLERTRIELAVLDFRPGAKRALPATVPIDRIDRSFLFGNARLALLGLGFAPSFRLR